MRVLYGDRRSNVRRDGGEFGSCLASLHLYVTAVHIAAMHGRSSRSLFRVCDIPFGHGWI